MAIAAVDALFPVNVVSQFLAVDVALLGLGIPQIGIAVALDAEIFVGWNPRAGPRRQLLPGRRGGHAHRGIALRGLCAFLANADDRQSQ